MNIKLIAKKNSHACKAIRINVPIESYTGKKNKTDLLINYGVSRNRLSEFYNKYPSAKKIPTLNKNIGMSKYRMLNLVRRHNVPVPISKLSLEKNDKMSTFIEKRVFSIGGKGIKVATRKTKIGRAHV